MARPLRPNIAGGVYHAMARGNGRQPIYTDDDDRERFLTLLERTVRRHRWECLAYCLMGNHYHLVVHTPLPNISRGMRMLNGVYAGRFNARHDRPGHLFQGRYRSVLIRGPEHLLPVLKYVIRNPVTAGHCARPDAWRWSSYAATVERRATGVVAASTTLQWFGEEGRGAGNFAAFMGNEQCEPLEGVAPGTLAFAVEPCDPAEQRPALEEILAADPTAAGIATAYHDHAYSLREIADVLGRSRASVGRELVAFESERMLGP